MSKASYLLQHEVVLVRQLASFIGVMVSSFYAILEGPLHYRALERDKLIGLGQNMNFDNKVSLSTKSIQEIQWWLKNVKNKNGKRIRPISVSRRCFTDASMEGYGGIDLISGLHTQGRWKNQECGYHINYLELLAVFYCMQAFYNEFCDIHIEIHSDSVSVVTYINNFGGMNSLELDDLSKCLWEWCLRRNIYISAVHVPGKLNKSADYYSRNFSDSTEWTLKKDIFERLCRHTFMPSIDLFASRLNNHLPKFVSCFPEPGAYAVNAFSLSWKDMIPYIFPPFNLIGKVLSKIVIDEVDRALMVVPFWFTQPWFPILLENPCDFPIRLPRHRDLLVLPHNGTLHPLGRKLKMIGVVLSGKACRVREFHQMLQILSQNLGHRAQENSIAVPGKDGICGILLDVPVQFVRLKV
ncbi:uncharacterized protein LOC132739516 [Ruditapes philippinarum]|uniref:uncharacterized protein LOC132739516 n=1 Tax=Ruditapes philippinarum TaxID=129788 RepID=UPI00295AFC34|nr:uncharacterized protein LOC132739516 [Ruditapes philippinarum]